MLPTYEIASKHLEYNSETGKIYWKTTKNGIKVGAEAGFVNHEGYRKINIRGSLQSSHRLAWLLHYGKWPEYTIDHIDGNKENDRIDNLRDVTNGENDKNKPMYKNNTSGHVGVYWIERDQKWQASIKVNGRNKSLGYFKEKLPAIFARIKAEPIYGYHKNHGRAA